MSSDNHEHYRVKVFYKRKFYSCSREKFVFKFSSSSLPLFFTKFTQTHFLDEAKAKAKPSTPFTPFTQKEKAKG